MAQITTEVENTEGAVPRLLTATIQKPNGKQLNVLLEAKDFKSGNTGWRGTIPRFVVGDHIYGGNILVYRMDRKNDDAE